MNTVTAGQAVYEAYQAFMVRSFPGLAPIGWDELSGQAQASWEGIAQAGVTADNRAALAAERERADRAVAEVSALGDRIGAAIRSAVEGERKRIRELADRTGAVCTGDEGTSCYFSALLADGEAPDA